jgi:hypothetical protein
MSDEGVRAAARAVRQFLPELVGAEAAEVDAEVAALLARPAEHEETGEQLRELLERREATSVFLAAVLDDEPYFRPLQVQPGAPDSFSYSGPAGGYSGLPGLGGYGGTPKYSCPRGDFDWWQLADEDPPRCPTHGCVLVLA